MAQKKQISTPSRSPGALYDCVFLGSVVLLSVAFYVLELGFYVDDWNVLAVFLNSHEQSVGGLLKSIYSAMPWARMRPIQLLYLSVLYKLFGLDPLGYHLINALVLTAMVLFFYLAMRELGQSRLLAITIPLIYILLPHYNTNRFWVAAFQANLSMALYFLSLYSDLRALRIGSVNFWRWKLISLTCLACSILAYEVAMPLFLLNLVLVWHRTKKTSVAGVPQIHKNLAASLAGSILALALVTGFKVLTSVRLGVEADLLLHAWNVLKAVVRAAYSGFGANLTLSALRHQPDFMSLAVAGVLGLLTFTYLYFAVRLPEASFPNRFKCLSLVLFGSLIYVFSYTVLLGTKTVAFPVADMRNRFAIAAAVGLAVAAAGIICLISSFLASVSLRNVFFCFALTLTCFTGCLISNTVASSWINAYRREQEILASVKQRFPTLTGNILLLDGACLESGPVYVFRYAWDFEGALRIVYGDPALRADLVSTRLVVGEEGLSTTLDGEERFYPYDQNVVVFHYDSKNMFLFGDARSAQDYLQIADAGQSKNCP